MCKQGNNIKIFLISHPNFGERYRYIVRHVSEVSKLPWEVVGVDGRELAREPEFSARVAGSNLSPGAIGCALAHRRAYERMQETGLSAAMVVEDDVQLPENIDQIARELANRIRPGEVIQLHNPMIGKSRFSRRNADQVLGMRLIYPMSPRSIRSASAYIITLQAAKRIFDLNNKPKFDADHWDAFYDSGCVSSYRILHPSPCRWVPFESVIGYISSDSGLGAVKNAVTNLPLGEALKRLRRRFIFWKRLRNVVLVDDPSPLDPASRSE